MIGHVQAEAASPFSQLVASLAAAGACTGGPGLPDEVIHISLPSFLLVFLIFVGCAVVLPYGVAPESMGDLRIQL